MGDLGRLGRIDARSKSIADHALVSADRYLDLGSQVVATGFLPSHSALLCGHPQVVVALRRGGLGRSTQDRSCPRRQDDGSIWMMFGDRLINPVLIVIAVSGEGRDGIGDLVEQSSRQSPAKHSPSNFQP
jgi:hypothetical protein